MFYDCSSDSDPNFCLLVAALPGARDEARAVYRSLLTSHVT